ncbi:GlcG/HbpS family heme-binding protein [Paracraurococcus lichenis]|uniref:Heme-binding protein n=1 Tax=Paracraurococcus lichenis TaxID=3064888 RepID=A0ABT9E1J4_9PROT|nr:heme-binding protein [Paracraurococcus sp. LOR1-02]MDO9709999.1 heme-binding protein [Paracraurococcus sp. LOR1-02]
MRIILAAAAAALLAMPVARAQPAPGYGPNVTLDAARKVVEAGIASAQQRNLQMAVAVVDTAGNLVAFARVDGTQTASLQVALDKAKSAATYRRPTKAFEDALVGGRMAILALPGAMPVEGGLLLTAENRIIGAVGVSGGTSAEDGQVAAAAIAGR